VPLSHYAAQAIALTESALAEHAAAAPSEPSKKRRSRFEPLAETPSLPVDLVSQIAKAKARSALTGQGPAAWAIGGECQARFTDGTWQPARVRDLVDGHFVVEFEGSQAVETVTPMDCKPRDLPVRVWGQGLKRWGA